MFRCIFKNYLGFHHESLDESMFEILHNRVASYFENNIEEIYPFIEHFLKSYDSPDRSKNILSDDLHAMKGQFQYALKELLRRESLQQPVLFVWEDIQWCDFPSLELLNDLLPLTLDSPVLFLLQYRTMVTRRSRHGFGTGSPPLRAQSRMGASQQLRYYFDAR